MIDDIRSQLVSHLGDKINVSIQLITFTPSIEIRIVARDKYTEDKLKDFDLNKIQLVQ